MRQHEHDGRLRRNVNRNVPEHIMASPQDRPLKNGLHAIPSGEPSPEFAAQFLETCERLFASLDDQQMKDVVLLRLEGHTDQEVGNRLNCSRRTVQRKLEIIRRHWERLEL